jgi:hypothetical protein
MFNVRGELLITWAKLNSILEVLFLLMDEPARTSRWKWANYIREALVRRNKAISFNEPFAYSFFARRRGFGRLIGKQKAAYENGRFFFFDETRLIRRFFIRAVLMMSRCFSWVDVRRSKPVIKVVCEKSVRPGLASRVRRATERRLGGGNGSALSKSHGLSLTGSFLVACCGWPRSRLRFSKRKRRTTFSFLIDLFLVYDGRVRLLCVTY